MKLAEYLRYSSDSQRCESIEEQQREIQEWAIQNNHDIIATYTDTALSGKFDFRPQFEKMLADAPTASWDGVIVFDLSRFSRGGEYGIVDSLRLTENGKILLSVTEQFGDDFGGKLVKYIKMLSNEEFIINLRANVKRGQTQNAINAMHNGGTPPLGYDLDPKTLKLKVNEFEAEAVRLIFSMYADHKSYSQICEALNTRGFKTKRNGNNFGKNSIYTILENKKYIGIYEWGKVQTKIQGRKKYFTDATPKDIICVENGCPAIIDKALFDKVQIMRISKQRSSENPKAKTDYLLRGKIKCGKCGCAYVGSSMKSHGQRTYAYVCSGKKNGRYDCDNRNISKEVIEQKVLDEIRQKYLSDSGIAWVETIIKQVNANRYNANIAKNNETILKIIDQLERKIRRQKEAYYDGIIELNEFKADKQKLEAEIEFQKSKLVSQNSIPFTADNIKHIIENYRQWLVTDKAIINEIVENVIITGENITVNLKEPPFPPHDNDPKVKQQITEHNSQTLIESTAAKDIVCCESPPPNPKNRCILCI